MMMKISDIKVGPRFRKDFGDIKSLAASIELVGYIIQPIGMTPNNWLAYGQRRLEAAKLLGWTEIPVDVVPTEDPDDLVLIQYYENAARKDFTASERVDMLEEIQRRRVGHRVTKERVINLSPFQQQQKGKKSRDIAAECTGVSPLKFQREKTIVQAARKYPKDLHQVLERLDAKKTSTEFAYKEVTRYDI
jgi:hypothetical protein